MVKIITATDAAKMVKENSRLMLPSFLAVGVAENLIDALVQVGTKNIHMISICTDFPDRGTGKLIVTDQVKSCQVSHIGTNPVAQEKYRDGLLDIEFIPQGTLVERVRAAGAGLGGVLTPTGLHTDVEKGKEKLEIDGKTYLLEKPIFGDIAFVRAHKADKMGNLTYQKTARNSNPVMAMASKIVIAEVDEILEVGDLSPESVVTPGMLVDYLVLHKN